MVVFIQIDPFLRWPRGRLRVMRRVDLLLISRVTVLGVLAARVNNARFRTFVETTVWAIY